MAAHSDDAAILKYYLLFFTLHPAAFTIVEVKTQKKVEADAEIEKNTNVFKCISISIMNSGVFVPFVVRLVMLAQVGTRQWKLELLLAVQSMGF